MCGVIAGALSPFAKSLLSYMLVGLVAGTALGLVAAVVLVSPAREHVPSLGQSLVLGALAGLGTGIAFRVSDSQDNGQS